MKNIHVLPTDKPSRLIINWEKDLCYKSKPYLMEGTQNIYITSDEEIKEGDWCIDDIGDVFKIEGLEYFKKFCKKIILTTDLELQEDGVQSIDDDFLEWFVKNSSCKEIEVNWIKTPDGIFYHQDNVPYSCYKIIIPKEEPNTAWVGVLHDKLNEYYPAEYELKDIYQGEGCLPNFPDEELCQIWCDSKYKIIPKQETLEEAAEIYNLNTINAFGDYQSFIDGAKWQQERMYSEEDVKTAFLDGWQLRDGDLPFPKATKKWFEQFKKKTL